MKQSTLLQLLVVSVLASLASSTTPSCKANVKGSSNTFWQDDYNFDDTAQGLMDAMKASSIDDYLKYLTSHPHMAGTSADFEQAEYLRSLWTSQGLDQVSIKPYEVRMSFPHPKRSSKVTIIDENGQVKFTSALLETPIEGTFYDETVAPAYIAFSANGSVESDELVFANYGSYEDLRYLEEELKINLAGRLLLIRYGSFFRGDKVLNAQRFGAAGVILYSDPADYSDPEGEKYPNSYYLPGEGVQRGTIVWKDGDSSTPMYPALPGAHRISEDKMDMKEMPTIPVQPIGFNDALKIMVQLSGPEAPPAWRGKLNTTYRIGPKLRVPGWKIRLEVHNEKKIVPTYTVVGFIRGEVEPDRYVIYGNHRDAWVFGSVDPSSATATMLELVKSYSQLMQKGWRPRRSILFCSWGGSEQGFIGVTEWVEEYLHLLSSRAVAYLNVDIAVMNAYNFAAAATPVLHELMKEGAKHVGAPNEPSMSLYEMWSTRRRFTKELITVSLSSVSDHAPFYQRAGVPCTYMSWTADPEKSDGVDYPLYHSTYETYDAMKNFIDPDFSHHLALGQLWAYMGIALADKPLLPFVVEEETNALKTAVDTLEAKYGAALAKRSISLAYVRNSISSFDAAAKGFQERLQKLDQSNELMLRVVNDQMMQLEKSFIYSEGLLHRSHMKNVIYGTSIFDQYSGSLLPGVEETLQHLTVFVDEESTSLDQWDDVRHQLSVVMAVIESATKTLQDVNIL